MRVALVYRSFHRRGSLARTTVELARHLSRSHDVHVFSIGSCTERSVAPACTFHDVPVSHVGEGRRFCARELRSFARGAATLLSRERFDVVHACAPSTWAADVLHVPGIAREEAALHDISGWRFAVTMRRPGNAARLLLERKALAHAGLRRIHVAAPSVRDALERRYGIASEHVLVVRPGVNLDEFRPSRDVAAARAAAGIDDPGTFVVLFCGSDFERKGLDRAIEALASARAAGAVLLVVGRGEREERYRRLAEDRGIGERVRFLGSRADAWRLYQAADALVLPTHADVWGVTPIEAMACGVPPIVSAAAGSSSAIRDGETGIVLPEPFDVRALRDAIDMLAADRACRAAMGRAGIVAARVHSWAERARRVEEDLLAVAERRLGSPRSAPAGTPSPGTTPDSERLRYS